MGSTIVLEIAVDTKRVPFIWLEVRYTISNYILVRRPHSTFCYSKQPSALIDMALRGKVAIVTGGSRGIGAEIVRALADEEALVTQRSLAWARLMRIGPF